jgi:membrane protease YdiL (CAAX protease family)
VNRALSWVAAAVVAIVLWFAAAPLPLPARAFTVFLAVPLPILAVIQLRALARVQLDQLPRIPVYLSSATTLWLLAVVAILAAQYSRFPPWMIGLRAVPPGIFVAWVVFIIGCAGLLAVAAHFAGQTESPILLHLLPVTRREQVFYVGLSITAGICEELVFRGFLMAALLPLVGSTILALVISSFLFGLLHAYQQPAGVARAALLGAALGAPYILAGTIFPSMVAHTLIDLIGGLWLVRRLT